MRVNRAIATSVLAVMALSVTACSSGGPSAGDASDTGEDVVRIGFFNPIGANVVTAANLKGVEDEAAKWGATVTSLDANFDQATQISQMQDAIASQQYDAWVVMPVNGVAVADTVKQAIEAGIVVVADWNNIGSDLASIEPQVEGITSVVAQPFGDQGQYIAEAIVSGCEDIDPCDAVYMPGSFNQRSEQVRIDALSAVIADYPNIVLHTSADGNFETAAAQAAANDTMLAIPGVDVFATPGDQMALGIVSAVEDAGRQDEIKVISAGTSEKTVQMVRDGSLFADIVALPYSEGVYSTRYAIQAVLGEGDVPPFLNSLDLSPIGPIATKETLSTGDGVDFVGEYEG
ncbi:sugar ABC transporter substrate-binding protein [Amnibacterium flavum]|uniref:Periplasmic binding protein domain-containing protein n=1 Tax=Amnibacterium flavum TaxID=2173173 RepID=A0A2V1HLK6_9MICO|nr:sugar ABC transporter substrate-binding protein [Amnibacterium flavum]PVZ93291.1 hypothetical protein DDQ50_16475 [Amnibacterium flavum]